MEAPTANGGGAPELQHELERQEHLNEILRQENSRLRASQGPLDDKVLLDALNALSAEMHQAALCGPARNQDIAAALGRAQEMQLRIAAATEQGAQLMRDLLVSRTPPAAAEADRQAAELMREGVQQLTSRARARISAIGDRIRRRLAEAAQQRYAERDSALDAAREPLSEGRLAQGLAQSRLVSPAQQREAELVRKRAETLFASEAVNAEVRAAVGPVVAEYKQQCAQVAEGALRQLGGVQLDRDALARRAAAEAERRREECRSARLDSAFLGQLQAQVDQCASDMEFSAVKVSQQCGDHVRDLLEQYERWQILCDKGDGSIWSELRLICGQGTGSSRGATRAAAQRNVEWLMVNLPHPPADPPVPESDTHYPAVLAHFMQQVCLGLQHPGTPEGTTATRLRYISYICRWLDRCTSHSSHAALVNKLLDSSASVLEEAVLAEPVVLAAAGETRAVADLAACRDTWRKLS